MASSVYCGDALPFLWINPLLNLLQVLLAGVLARRLCGAALDMRRPQRLLRFVFGAAVPAVAVTTTIAVLLAFEYRDYSLAMAAFTWGRLFMMEVLGLAIVTPMLLLVARAHRFRAETPRSLEIAAIVALATAVFLWVFSQSSPLLCLVFPALMLAAHRLSPPWTAAVLLWTLMISGVMTLGGHGPISAAPVPDVDGLAALPLRVRQMPHYYIFMLAAALTTLTISVLMAERRDAAARLAQRTALALRQRSLAEEAMAAKSRFLAVMSHEMRTPLNSISGHADLLSRRTDLAADVHAQVSAIRAAGETVLEQVEDVLDASRGPEALRADVLDVDRLMRDACAPARSAAKAKGVAFHLDIECEEGSLALGDDRRLKSAVRPLLSNAVKFTNEGEVRVRARLEGECLTVEVADTGAGVKPELQPRLFDLFSQGDDSLRRNQGGAGVGLSAARLNARAMGGDVVLVSSSPQGSVFRLTARLAKATGKPPARMTTESGCVETHGPERPLRTLLVDDHPGNRLVLRMMMEAAASDIVEAVDGLDAVEAAAAQDFDLILMDVRMPRLDGLEAARRIRRLATPSAAAVILGVTAEAMPEDIISCYGAGMDGHLAKPVTHERLYDAIQQAFRAAGEGDGESEAS
ncbi:response regulator [Brevundimonas diminuta]|uniref:hybrid sensor histidine kinase/response regulator n=1 Tax=Brevundimonas diminuta TaxID=293 RepID=UPI0020976752|nr:response regulator [Brevundimonas diminuta]MCO8017976.1 response regulator [Brevundimonas diminuta]MCO8022499.1 response regulator [Brevundimonas diminuta]